MERVIIVFARYVCAVMVACVVSAAFFFGLMSLLFFIGVDGSGAPYASCFVLPIMGFGGVLAGKFLFGTSEPPVWLDVPALFGPGLLYALDLLLEIS